MTPITSLQESAETFLRAGRDHDAQFAANMACAAHTLNSATPGLGDALYRHWAKQTAERAARFQRNSTREPGL